MRIWPSMVSMPAPFTGSTELIESVPMVTVSPTTGMSPSKLPSPGSKVSAALGVPRTVNTPLSPHWPVIMLLPTLGTPVSAIVSVTPLIER